MGARNADMGVEIRFVKNSIKKTILVKKEDVQDRSTVRKGQCSKRRVNWLDGAEKTGGAEVGDKAKEGDYD